MTIAEHRVKIGNFIIYANLSIFLLLLVLFLLKGFTPEELVDILKFIIPIKSIYMTALVNYVVVNKKILQKQGVQPDDHDVIDPLYRTLSLTLVYCHILFLTLFFVLAAFNVITFVSLTYLVALLETFFGCYVGTIISDMFRVKSES